MADTPNIRFEGFAGVWEQRKLGDVVEFLDTQRKPLEGTQRVSGPYPYYGASGIVDYVDGYIFDEELVLLSEDGANIMDRNYPVCFLASGKYWVNNHAHVLKTREGNENNFVCNSLERKDYSQYNTGMAMPKLNKDVCKNISIYCPCFEEQKKIGDYYRNLDYLITLHQRKCDETKELKKYMLQKLFPQNGKKIPEIRFAGFTDDWEQRKLGNYSELITKGTTPSSFCEDGNVTFVKIEALREKRVIKELCSAISEEIHKGELSRSILKENDIVFAIAGTVGKCAVITRNILPANTNQAYAIIRLESSINRDFVYFSLTSKQMELYINQSKSVGAQPNLSLAQMNAFEFLCPCKKEEQQKIGDYFSTLDSFITLHQRKCDELKEVKKFMLQNMFPQKG